MSLINIERTIELDVYDHDTTPSVIKAIQLDEGTRAVYAVIQNSRQDYDIGQNATVSLTVLRPDKTKVQITGQPFISYTGTDGTMYGAKAELSDVSLAVKGNLKAQFKITSGEQELRTEIFTINNGEALDAGDGDWAGDLDGHNLDEMAQDIEDTKAAVTEMETDVSELKEGFNALDERVEALEQGGSGGGLTAEIKTALLQIAQKVAYVDDGGQTYYGELYNALYPPATLVSISAVYTQSGTVYDTDTLDTLKTDLVVTGTYSDATTRNITEYTLSGTLTEGTSTITVSYGGKTTTFTVVVTKEVSTDVPVYYTDVSIKGNAPGTSDGSVKQTSIYPTNAISAVFDAEAASYRVVDNGTHDRFRFYGITEDLDVTDPSDFASIIIYRIADSTTVSGIDSLSEYVIDNSVTQYKTIFVYLASSKTGNSPDLTVTRIS